MSDRLVRDVRAAYEDGADAWADGPERVYRALADALLDVSPEPLEGALVLDLGSGTGVASHALRERGARPVGLDLAHAMLRHGHEARPPGSVGDALSIPFRSGAFDAVVAAFCLNHLGDLVVGLTECARVCRSGGWVLASTFPATGDHPAKEVVEGVLCRFGYERPAWYERFRSDLLEVVGHPEALTAAAAEAGLAVPRVERHSVPAGLDDPAAVVSWRTNMPHTIGFVGSLEPEARRALADDAVAALPPRLPPEVDALFLVARVP